LNYFMTFLWLFYGFFMTIFLNLLQFPERKPAARISGKECGRQDMVTVGRGLPIKALKVVLFPERREVRRVPKVSEGTESKS
jgi:hypothetical protein